jgi:hypothetical protein
MAGKIDDGGSAFPGSADTAEGHQMREYGMSLRDWFAGQALAGMQSQYKAGRLRHDYAATDAYAFADAMLAARRQQDGET